MKTDIIDALCLQEPLVVWYTNDRPNLFYSVREKSNSIYNDMNYLFGLTAPEQDDFQKGPSIIYCLTRKETENVCHHLQGLGLRASYYNAAQPKEDRAETHRQFMHGEIQIVVATIAYGMGIDKPDIRMIAHYGPPRDVESYTQMVGRAG